MKAAVDSRARLGTRKHSAGLEALFAAFVLAASAHGSAQGCGNTTGLSALPDLGRTSYLGFQGGLYPNGSNAVPAAHLQNLLSEADLVVPRDANGIPDAERGLTGFIAIGMSSLCHKWGTFERLEDPNPARHPRLVLVNGANGGSAADKVKDPSNVYWTKLLERVAAVGLTPAQVQVAWLEQAYEDPPSNFPVHAMDLQADLVTILGIARGLFPNLRLAYLSCRSYGNYTIPPIEPVSFENGYAVKWVIEQQLAGDPALNWDPTSGPVRAPLLLWGPYLWANGTTPNGEGPSQGLSWCACDYELCFDRHLDLVGETKVWQLMHDQLAGEPVARRWFERRSGPPVRVVTAEADAHVSAQAPASTFGAEPKLLCHAGEKVAFLRFDLSGLRRPVLHAKLAFRNEDEGSTFVRTVSDTSWDEATLSFLNAPPIDGTVAYPMPRVTRDGTRAVDVTEVINADSDGVIGFAMFCDDAFDSAVLSREGGQPATLTLVPLPVPGPRARLRSDSSPVGGGGA